MYYRHREDLRRLTRLAATQPKRYLASGAYYDRKKGRYVRVFRTKDSKHIKRFCNHKVRRNLDLADGNNYRRVHSFWNEYW